MEIYRIRKLSMLFLGLIFLIGTRCMKNEAQFNENEIFSEFEKKVNKTNGMAEKQKLADELVNNIKNTTYPVFENDSTVVLLYQGDKDSVKALGDMGEWSEQIPFKKVNGTNLFYLRATYPPDARLEYLLSFDMDSWPMPDPLNKYVVLNGFGPNSELAMPLYQRHPIFNDYLTGKKGEYVNIKSHELPAGILKYSKTVHVYLPPEYDQSDGSYSCVYIQDGEDYIEFAQSAVVLDQLIKSQQIEPMIGVFIPPPNRHKGDMPNRMTEYGMSDDYVNFMADELVPFIDSAYRTEKEPSARMVVGDSFGGLISAYTPFLRPDVFGIGYSQSGYVSFQDDHLIKLYRDSDKKPIFLYIDVGLYERTVGANMLPASETDFLEGNRRFKKVLEEKGYNFVYREYPEGHTWGNWRRHFIDALIYHFGY